MYCFLFLPVSHLQNGKKYIIREWAEGISQELKTCSCQMESFIKLLSLTADMVNDCAGSFQCTVKQDV